MMTRCAKFVRCPLAACVHVPDIHVLIFLTALDNLSWRLLLLIGFWALWQHC
jgi:hypothetical protein